MTLLARSAAVVAVLAFVLVTAGVVSGLGAAEELPATVQAIEAIPQPSERVPFSADVVKRTSTNVFTGLYYRRSDGSFREEGVITEPGKAPDKGLMIMDLTKKVAYILRQNRWATAPVDAVAPPLYQRRVAMNGISGLVPEAATHSGLTVYRGTRGNGDYELLAPDLNFFPVVVQGGKADFRTEYTNFKIGEPDAALFELPEGAVIQKELPTIRSAGAAHR